MAARNHTFTVASASGTGTGYSPYVTGFIESVQYVKANYADTVDFTITTEATGAPIWVDTNITASETVRPRAQVHTTAGIGAEYEDDGNTPVRDRIAIGRDRVKVVLAQAGTTTSGTFIVTVSDR